MLRWWLIVIPALFAVVLFLCSRQELETGTDTESALSLSKVLSGEDEGFTRALRPRKFTFPEDHGPHPEFKTEWWYYTGNLETVTGRAFGFQFTLFRSALSSEVQERASRWSTNHVYMAHFALSDLEGGKIHAFERFARDAMGLAGVNADPLRLWLEDWCVEGKGTGRIPGVPIMDLKASEADVGVALTLDSMKPIVLQGDQGLSRKGNDPGNASYYYSLTRLEAKGKIRLPGRVFEVKGWAWMDREWSTSVLEKEQIGWDWFALQLENGAEIMFYRMRRMDGSVDPFSKGCWIDPEGHSVVIGFDEMTIETLASWKNRDGKEYPSGWRLRLPARDVVLEIMPLLADQELRFGIQYWEGAVSVEGSIAGQPVRGKGYVELTGYAGAPPER